MRLSKPLMCTAWISNSIWQAPTRNSWGNPAGMSCASCQCSTPSLKSRHIVSLCAAHARVFPTLKQQQPLSATPEHWCRGSCWSHFYETVRRNIPAECGTMPCILVNKYPLPIRHPASTTSARTSWTLHCSAEETYSTTTDLSWPSSWPTHADMKASFLAKLSISSLLTISLHNHSVQVMHSHTRLSDSSSVSSSVSNWTQRNTIFVHGLTDLCSASTAPSVKLRLRSVILRTESRSDF